MKTLFLHVGIHKTGTTSVQNTLFMNKSLLKEHGYLYPDSFGKNHSIELYSAFCDNPEKYHINMKKDFSIDQINEYNLNNLNNLKKEINETSCSNIILSGEDISVLTKKNLFNLKKYINTELNISKIIIILNIREVISFLNSAYQQTIVDNTYINLENHYNFYQSKIDKFLQVFKNEKLLVSKYEDSCKNSYGPVGYFCEIIGLKKDFIETLPIENNNIGLSNKAIDFIKYVNKSNKVKNNHLYIEFLSKISGDKFYMEESIQKKLLLDNESSNKWLKDNIGIEYSKVDIKSPSSLIFDDRYYEDIILIFDKFDVIMKKLLNKYLLMKLNIVEDELSKNILKKLLIYIDTKFNNDIFKNLNLKIKNGSESADILRDVALAFEQSGDITTAKTIIQKAHNLRENGPFIKQKLEEYKKILNKRK